MRSRDASSSLESSLESWWRIAKWAWTCSMSTSSPSSSSSSLLGIMVPCSRLLLLVLLLLLLSLLLLLLSLLLLLLLVLRAGGIETLEIVTGGELPSSARKANSDESNGDKRSSRSSGLSTSTTVSLSGQIGRESCGCVCDSHG
ncbi:hypothetical protein CAOG_010072 [Capsaspora owczarzaki ATCC 30864]|uniref:Uncharacterized protein n=1 Tax=Capsaspora owczarzaki (strain ATCC 30864) TaxID=595528 RepID=A0A0D2VZ24_CAPO3|nr:hypothetical protein CAOG_010072 [Capsaspora owczarzaki ATCC 30864]